MKNNSLDVERLNLIDFFKIIYKNKILIIFACIITVLMSMILNPEGAQSYKFTINLFKSKGFDSDEYSFFKDYVVKYGNHIKNFLDQSEQESLYIEAFSEEKNGYLALDVIANTKDKSIINNYVQYTLDAAKEARIDDFNESMGYLKTMYKAEESIHVNKVVEIIALASDQEIKSEEFRRVAGRLLNIYRLKWERNNTVHKELRAKIKRIKRSMNLVKESQLFKKIDIGTPEKYGVSDFKLNILFGLIYGLVISFIIIFYQIIRNSRN